MTHTSTQVYFITPNGGAVLPPWVKGLSYRLEDQVSFYTVDTNESLELIKSVHKEELDIPLHSFHVMMRLPSGQTKKYEGKSSYSKVCSWIVGEGKLDRDLIVKVCNRCNWDVK